MPRQNRVTPFGEIVAVAARGALMGNRGCLHDDQGRLGRARWRSRTWIYCVLDFKRRRRAIMSPGRYTELFFLDEATALAAGHRPCGECQRGRLAEFRTAWRSAGPTAALEPDPGLAAIDRELHLERTGQRPASLAMGADLAGLADGLFVCLPEQPAVARLIRSGALWRWTPSGYSDPRPIAEASQARVLTPTATARAIAAGFRPLVDPSARARNEKVEHPPPRLTGPNSRP